MSPKTLLLATAALGAVTIAAVPAFSDTTTPATPPAATDNGAPGQPPARPLPFRAQILFNLVDTNGDGSIDQTEFATFEKAVFNAIDKDHDGKLSVAEFEALAGGMGGMGGPGGPMRPGMGGHPMARFMMQHPGWGHGGRPGPGMQRPDGGPAQQGMLDNGQQPGADQGVQPQDFASLDKNGDGVITPDEFSQAMPGFPGLGGPVTPDAPPPAPPAPDAQQ